VDATWREIFRNRMRHFEARGEPRPGEATVSIKVRVSSGCFHREHSPRAYELIDKSLSELADRDATFGFEEHESGPEILAFVALTTVGLGLAASVINLITAIIKARSEGIRKDDRPSEPLEVIVRRVHADNEFREETVLRVGHRDAIDETNIEQRLTGALRKLLKDDSSPKTSTERTGSRGQKKQAKKKARPKSKS
jgi:hypothetical protein